MRMTDIIKEVHPDTLEDSFSKSLDKYRLYVLNQLKKHKTDFSTVYILGSWYGNLSLLMARDNDFDIGEIINVELDKDKSAKGQELANKQGYDNISSAVRDANKLNYKKVDDQSLIINQSVTNISGSDWFNNIPSGTMVLLNARNNDPGAVNKFDSLNQFVKDYPLSKIIFKGKKKFIDPETEYDCYILIGIK